MRGKKVKKKGWIERAPTRARPLAKAHSVTGVYCDTVVAADARVTPGVKRSVLRFPGMFSVRTGASEAPRGV